MFQNIFAVPNAPCGVESYIKSFSFEFAHSVFLMHRVELKASHPKVSDLQISKFLMHRVELKDSKNALTNCE